MKFKKILFVIVSVVVIVACFVVSCFAYNAPYNEGDVVFSPYGLSCVLNFGGRNSPFNYVDNMPSGIGVSPFSYVDTDVIVYNGENLPVGQYSRNYDYSFRDSNAYIYGEYSLVMSSDTYVGLNGFSFSYIQALRKSYADSYLIKVTSKDRFIPIAGAKISYNLLEYSYDNNNKPVIGFRRHTTYQSSEWIYQDPESGYYTIKPFKAMLGDGGSNTPNDYIVCSGIDIEFIEFDVSSIQYNFINFTGEDKTVENYNNALKDVISNLDFNEEVVVNPVYIGDTDFTDWLVNATSSIVNAPIFGSETFTIGTLLIIVISLGVFLIFLKIFAGG